jgi:hypothetical protein
VGDPWDVGRAPVSVTIGNRPPAVSSWSVRVPTTQIQGPCCKWEGWGCVDYSYRNSGGTAPRPVAAPFDPDGDPVEVALSPGTNASANGVVTCGEASCGDVTFTLAAGPPVCRGGPWSGTVNVLATDGAATAAGTITVTD